MILTIYYNPAFTLSNIASAAAVLPVFTRVLVLAEVLACLPDTLEVGKRIRAKSLVSAKRGTVRS